MLSNDDYATLIELLNDYYLSHRAPEANDYNECDIDPCMWCERARPLIEKMKAIVAQPDDEQ